MADERDKGPTIPRSTDEENEAIDTTSAEPLRGAKIEEPKKEETAKTAPKKAETPKEQPKKSESKKEEPKKEEPNSDSKPEKKGKGRPQATFDFRLRNVY